MDLYWSGDDSAVKNLSGASLVAVVKDGKGNICGENKVNLPDISDGNLKEEIVDVLLKARCSQISYDVSLLADNQDLAKVSYKELTEKSGGGISDYGVYAKYGLLAVFVFGFLFFIRKGKKNIMDKKFAHGAVLSLPIQEADKLFEELSISKDFSNDGNILLAARWSPPPPPPRPSPPSPPPPPPPRYSPLRRHLIPIRHHFLLHRLCQHLKSNLTYL